MEPCLPWGDSDRSGLIYRFHTGYRFRIGGDNARNDGIQAEMDIGYQSKRFFEDRFSIETGTTTDLFGETQNLGAYLQLNYHHGPRWIFSIRTMGAGVSDEKERASVTEVEDGEDFGGLFDLSLMGSYRLDRNFLIGLRFVYNVQAYGSEGNDQGTQHSLSPLLNLAYLF